MDGFAYLASRGAAKIDVLSPAAPKFHTYPLQGPQYSRLAVAGPFLYMTGSLTTDVVRTSSIFTVEQSLPLAGRGVAVAGSRAVVVEESSVSVVDLKDPVFADEEVVGSVPTPSALCGSTAFGCGAILIGDRAYTAGESGVNVIDVNRHPGRARVRTDPRGGARHGKPLRSRR